MLMRRAAGIALIVLLLPGLAGRTAGPARDPAQAKVDQAIERALDFLKKQQAADGTWAGGGRSGRRDPAITALAVMAFLSAGHVPGEGPYRTVVDKGVRAVLTFQNPRTGLISTERGWEMYQHGICTLMLAEVAGMSSDTRFAAEIRSKLVKAVALILRAQRKRDTGFHRGGWRYQVGLNDSDMSVTGWQIMALRAAKNLGCDVPARSIEDAVDYIKRSQDERTGGFCYMARGRGVTIPCTGTGILALEICGKNWHHSREAHKAGAYLLDNLPRWNRAHFSYGIYYCAQAMFQLGGRYWTTFRPFLHKALLPTQQGNGSWTCRENIGPNYSTAMAVLALTVEYRYLPIYQRNEEEEKAN
jgi:hypothetical protein